MPATRIKRLRKAVHRRRVARERAAVADLLQECGALMPHPPRRRRVAILLSPDRFVEADAWLSHFADDRVLLVGERVPQRKRPRVKIQRASSSAEIYESLKKFGATHVLIDLRSTSVAQHREMWEQLVFHIDHHGIFLVPRRASNKAATTSALTAWCMQLAARVPDETVVERARAHATAAVALLDKCLIIVKRGHHYLAVNDDEVDTLLPKRERSMSVETVTELTGGELESRVHVTSHESSVQIAAFDSVLPYPRMRLRRYSGPMTFAGRTLMYTGHSILPDSYRFYRARQLDHPTTTFLTADFHTIPAKQHATDLIDGDFYVLDPQWTGHFGHIMTEVVGRLWGWEEAKHKFPDLRVLFAVPPGETSDPLLARLLEAYGIPESDLFPVDHPVRVRSVVSATTMWHNYRPRFVHPLMRDVWRRIGDNLYNPSAPTYERIFVSRSPAIKARVCHNGADVERLFERHNFTVIYPEQLDVSEQAAIFREAKVIAGFGGSGMFNLMYAENLERLILLGHEAYNARNEHLYSSLIGGTADYFWSTPDIPQTIGSYNYKAFISDWTFDFERNGAALEDLLSSL